MKMVTPTKEAILERARQLYFKANPDAPTPEESELVEGGYAYEAQNMLMRNDVSFRTYLEKEAAQNGLRIVTEDEHGKLIAYERARSELAKEREKAKQLEKLLKRTRSAKQEERKAQTLPFDTKEALKTGVFVCGSSGSGKTILAHSLTSLLMKCDVTVYVFDPAQSWQESGIPYIVEVLPNVSFQINWKQSCIYDISRLTHPQRQEFANQWCRALMDHRKAMRKSRHPIFVWFEDGHTYFPQGCMRAKRHSDVVELVTLGQNFDVRFGAITQFPSMIDKLLVKMTKQRYFGWTSETNDVRYIEGIIGANMASRLKLLNVGQFVYDYPVRGGCTKEIQVPMFRSEITPQPIPTEFAKRDTRQVRNGKGSNIRGLDALSLLLSVMSIIIWLLIIASG